MEDVGKNVVFNLHPNYKNIHQKIYVRITNLPVYDQIRNIRYCTRTNSVYYTFFIIFPCFYVSFFWVLQADPFEYNDSYWRSCDPTFWSLSPVATGKVWLQQVWNNFGAILSEFLFRSEGWFLPRMPIKRTIYYQCWAGEHTGFPIPFCL